MAGIYIHVPFCKQACYYCDFHFSTQHSYKAQMLVAMQREIFLQKDYFSTETISTIYFGGGTPSLLSSEDIKQILYKIDQYYTLEENVEITLEANPDDLDTVKLQQLKNIGVNRLSIGIQSFKNVLLKKMHRAHNVQKAITCFYDARKAGFDNISIDLIYAIPTQTIQMWEDDLRQAIKLSPEHIAAYMLTIEPKTVFAHWQKKGIIVPPSDEDTVVYFDMLTASLSRAGYIHYEISNFCRKNKLSKHNSSYWLQKSYLGIGPSAHSYNGVSRQYNVSNNHLYMQSISQDKIPCTVEMLTQKELINEYLLTHLRTFWGCDLDWLKKKYNYDLLQEKNHKLKYYQQESYITINNDTLFLTSKGKILADQITLDFMV